MCDCMAEIDQKLAEKNTQISKAIVFRPPGERLMITTEIIAKKRGSRPVTLFATYCPFCGEAYGEGRDG